MRLSPLVCLLVFDICYSQHVVFPLANGDKWYFDDSRVASVVSDTLMPDGMRYSILSGLPLHVTRYERQQGDSVFEYLLDCQESRLIYDFTRSPGDTLYTVIRSSDTLDLFLS